MAPSSVPETAEGSPCRQNRARRDPPASCPAPQAPKQLLRYRSFLIINYFKHKKQMKNDTATPTSGPNLQRWLGFPPAPASLGPHGPAARGWPALVLGSGALPLAPVCSQADWQLPGVLAPPPASGRHPPAHCRVGIW